MGDGGNPLDDYERVKARIMEEAAKEAAAKFERDFAEGMRIVKELPQFFKYTPPTAQVAQPLASVSRTVSELLSSIETVAYLTDQYRTHPDSGFHKLRYRTRENYNSVLKRLENDIGTVLIAALDEPRVRQQHAIWVESGEAMAHALINMLRIIAAFGTKVLKSRACRELKLTLHDIRFPVVKGRTERMTEEMADAVRAMAHKLRRPSLALAQAIQWETGLRQKDVAGEWVPTTEPGVSDVIYGDMKWLRGLRWSSIDQNLILRHKTSRSQKDVEFDLRKMRMVMEEFDRLKNGRPQNNDPIIVFEKTQRPYLTHTFRREWRKIADAAGVPKAIKNMDSRPENQGRPDVDANKEARRR